VSHETDKQTKDSRSNPIEDCTMARGACATTAWAGIGTPVVKKSECERPIRSLAREWFDGLPAAEREHPSWTAFKAWLEGKGYSQYLDFRSRAGAEYDAEMWFDDELGQNWRR
jgi:hypothetical protein